MADHFEGLLNDRGISFEKDESEYGRGNLFLYAVKTSHRKEAVYCNFVAFGKNRKPLIRIKFLRYFVVIFFIVLVGFAIIGSIYKEYEGKSTLHKIGNAQIGIKLTKK